MSHKKPKLQDALIDQRTKQELEQLLERNKDCFAEDERQISTTPLFTMSIDTGDHPPVAKRPYTLALTPWLGESRNWQTTWSWCY